MHSPLEESAFAGAFRAGDSKRFSLDLKGDRAKIIANAIKVASDGFPAFGPLHATAINGRQCSSITDYSQNLILRILARFIARRFRVEAKGRDRVAKGVIDALADSTPIYIVRRDIASFYETIPLDKTIRRLTRDVLIPAALRQHIECFFSTFSPASAAGLPRGICLSPVLAEMAMEEFDKAVKDLPGVYRYFRYSDDILIFSYEPTAFIESKLEGLLPAGMKFNESKSSSVSLDCSDKSASQLEFFEYLGYGYKMSNLWGDKNPRRVHVGIAGRKIKKLKTRVFCSLKIYAKDNNFLLLLDRLRFLCSNYVVYRQGVESIKSSIYVKSGIYYNYRLCGTYSHGVVNEYQGEELKSLDAFYHFAIKKVNAAGASFSISQLDQLRQLSFYKGYALKMTSKYSAVRVQEMKRAWKNV